MSKNSFDDDWDVTPTTGNWNDQDNLATEKQAKSVKLRIKINPKIASFSAIAIVLVIVLASVLPGLFSKDETPKISQPTSSASPMAAAPTDMYAQPKLLQLFIDNSLASSVTVFCANGSGSAWAIDLSDDMSTSKDDAYPTELVTNHHVIEGCESSGVTIVPMGTKDKYDAYVYSYDRSNDLAILMTSKYLAPIATVQPGNEAKVGQWVMAVGSPGVGDTTLDGTITKGTITNLRDDFVITDTTINPGNSGGPLLNAAGQVIAVVSAKIVEEKIDNIGLARNISLICKQLNECSKKRLLK